MNTRLLLIVIFTLGFGFGWLSRNLWVSESPQLISQVPVEKPAISPGENHVITNHNQSLELVIKSANDSSALKQTDSTRYHPQEKDYLEEEQNKDLPLLVLFNKLLNDRLYYDAMVMYQDQYQRDEHIGKRLKDTLLNHLRTLLKARKDNDFSELTDNYLAIYYDDIDVLLLLADFNRSNGSYLETVNVYLLAKTYAYTDIEQQQLLSKFNSFVKEIDHFYTSQEDWFSLGNFYSHIDSSGLMTSHYQYRQALVYLRSGEEYSAIEQLKQLTDDSQVGEQATIVLNKLTGNGNQNTGQVVSSSALWENAERVALQQLGNQYLVGLTLNRRDDVKLLIDTGASMTTLSQSSFDALNSNRKTVEQGRRIFRTANGVVKGTIYSVPELSLGPHIIKNTQIAVLDFEMEQGIDGLLGMNVLGQFRFQIDQDNASLLLNRK